MSHQLLSGGQQSSDAHLTLEGQECQPHSTLPRGPVGRTQAPTCDAQFLFLS